MYNLLIYTIQILIQLSLINTYFIATATLIQLKRTLPTLKMKRFYLTKKD